MDLAILIKFIVGFIAVILSLTVHEFCHALAAFFLGDKTAYRQGRLTLNPLAHIDPVGTLLIPMTLLFVGSPIAFGYAKPVPYNPYNLSNYRRDSLLVALAGPVSNFVLCLIFGLIFKILLSFQILPADNLFYLFLVDLIIINVVLAVFNLIPVSPLDGSKILFNILPAKPQFELWQQKLEIYGPFILLLLLMIDSFYFPFLDYLIGFALFLVSQILSLPGFF